MFKSLNNPYPFSDELNFNLKSISGISLGIFLFLLFFLPLNPLIDDFNKKLLVIAGFGVITLVLLLLLRVAVPAFFSGMFTPEKWTVKKELLLHLLFVSLNSVAFSFYARYVGGIPMSFHAVVKIILVSLIPVVALAIIYEYDFLKKRLENMVGQIKNPEFQQKEGDDTGIEFQSENQSERLFLFQEQIILVKAANNYIEIIFRQGDKTTRRLIRNTLQNAEKLLSKNSSFIRVHRSYIVNVNSIRKINKSSDGLKLLLYDYPKGINVSRQYVLKVKDALQLGE